MHVNLTSLQNNIVHHHENISLFLIGSSPLANSSQPPGIDQGPICTISEKAVLDKFSVITNALQMQMVYHEFTNLAPDRQSPDNLQSLQRQQNHPKKWKHDFFFLIICCKAIILSIKLTDASACSTSTSTFTKLIKTGNSINSIQFYYSIQFNFQFNFSIQFNSILLFILYKILTLYIVLKVKYTINKVEEGKKKEN